jgi:hypothetical protein
MHSMPRLIVSLIVPAALSLPAAAQYPDKPVTVIVPFAAGGPRVRELGDNLVRRAVRCHHCVPGADDKIDSSFARGRHIGQTWQPLRCRNCVNLDSPTQDLRDYIATKAAICAERRGRQPALVTFHGGKFGACTRCSGPCGSTWCIQRAAHRACPRCRRRQDRFRPPRPPIALQ